MEVNVKNLKYSPKEEYFMLSVEYGGKVEPGQFFRLKTPTGPYVARPYSVYDFEDGTLTFLVKSGGEFEQHLKTSCKVEIDGPLGNALPVLDKPLLVSGGVGYAPLHFYAKRYPSLSIIGAKGSILLALDPFLVPISYNSFLLSITKTVVVDELKSSKVVFAFLKESSICSSLNPSKSNDKIRLFTDEPFIAA